ncbi:pyruvate kinase [Niallia circulans]|uniref:Pyruvate kinase n=1 Tax=Niallia circulans TaxID=1397 RepID=A0A553SJA5_NIACI|nr:pyruvate kinase [Niallia circulans]TRZ37085.1 pyruvate kinase [Niallia circulans]
MIDKVCTIGPASNNQKILQGLIEKGMTIVRLNMSHGTQADHLAVMEMVRDINKTTGSNVRILGDLQGPKIRLGKIKEDKAVLNEGDSFSLTIEEIIGDESRASVDYKGLIKDIKVGSRVLINDGEVELNVIEIDENTAKTIVKAGGMIASRKGVNVPGTSLSLPAITEKDKGDIEFLVKHHVDIIACSFIRQAVHLQHIKKYVSTFTNTPPKLMAKIETLEAVTAFTKICEEADAIMLARGDLGVELPYYWIPLLQKAILAECANRETYVVTATQMLQSMTENAVPTRAEVTDVFQAVQDGTNAVMLSAESAVGRHPLESITVLAKTAAVSERFKQPVPFELSSIVAAIQKELS